MATKPPTSPYIFSQGGILPLFGPSVIALSGHLALGAIQNAVELHLLQTHLGDPGPISVVARKPWRHGGLSIQMIGMYSRCTMSNWD